MDPREDGEVVESGEQKTGNDNRQHSVVDADEAREEAQARARRADEFAGKQQQYVHTSSGFITSLGKRSWGGSAASDERNRSARRPRRDEFAGENGEGGRLPPLRDVLGNPWREGEEFLDGGRDSVVPPVAVSTPRQQPPRAPQYYRFDSEANVSGSAPTPHSVSTVASNVRPRAAGATYEEGAGRRSARTESATSTRVRRSSRDVSRMVSGAPRSLSRVARPAPSADAAGMDIDDDDGGSLLRTPPPGQTRGRRFHDEDGRPRIYKRTLKQTLMDPADAETGYGRQWCGGYAPELMRLGPQPTGTSSRRRAVDGLRESDTRRQTPAGGKEDDVGEAAAPEITSGWKSFSAVPNTRAWDFRNSERTRHAGLGVAGAGEWREESPGNATERQELNETRSYAAGRYSPAPSRTPTRDEDMGEEYDRDEDDLAPMEPKRHDARDSQGMPTGMGRMAAHAHAREEGATDMPRLVEDPHDDRWTIHFEDTEAILKGLSPEFVNLVRWGEEPIVPFTVFNFKYTENDAILHHIESSVSSLVTLLTGETNVYVVPPEPDWLRKQSSRDLPFVWIIRGLSAAGPGR